MTDPTISYMICATPRSGSTLLCEALRNTGLAGNPDEYFGPMHVARWTEKWQTQSETDYLEKVMAHGSGENGVWGVKVMRLYWQNVIDQLRRVQGSVEMSDVELLNVCFPNLRFIWVTRRNKVRQAMSWLKFVQGAAWYWEDDKPQTLDRLEFRPDVIEKFMVETAVHETAWLEFFRQVNVQPYVVVYEDFVNAYEGTAKNLLTYLGIAYPENLDFGERRIRKQADGLTDEWVEKYLLLFKKTESM